MDSDDDRVEVGQLNRHIPEPDGKEEKATQVQSLSIVCVTDINRSRRSVPGNGHRH